MLHTVEQTISQGTIATAVRIIFMVVGLPKMRHWNLSKRVGVAFHGTVYDSYDNSKRSEVKGFEKR